MQRLYSLDYLRGLAAFGIMIFHYFSWTIGSFSSESLLGRVGVYGVSIFYVLSGLTLFFVYFDKMIPSKNAMFAFFKKRFLRIFPLLWLVTLVAVLSSKNELNFYHLFLNVTGLFGFIKWDAYLSTGVWSIGNELVFYFFFPFFIIFSKYYKALMILLSAILFFIYIYFAFFLLSNNSPLSEQWSTYINPLNQVFLFLGGFLIGLFFNKINFNKALVYILLTMGLSVFIFFPVKGDTINLVTNFNRIIFTLASFMICLSFYKLNLSLPKFLHKIFTLLGEISYSLYLIHPIVFGVIRKVFLNLDLSPIVQIVISIIFTLICSYFVYHYFERFFMNLGKKENSKLQV